LWVETFRTRASWQIGFTQEWPLGSQKHQLSYVLPFGGMTGAHGLGDVLINYRYQVLTEAPGRLAFSPRLSVILPTGNEDRGLGSGVVGWQVNLPVSKQRGDLYFHLNGGGTWLPGVASGAADVTLFTPHAAASAIWRLRPMLNAMVESVFESSQEIAGSGTTLRQRSFTLSPGVRGGWNLGDHQLIIGLAVPVTWTAGTSEAGVFGYFSYELPFAR